MGAAAGAAAGAAVAAHAAIANAIKASGVLVRVDPDAFLAIANRQKAPLVVYATSGYIRTSHQYLVSYKGMAFFTKSPTALPLPGDAEVVVAQKFWMPS